MFSKRHKHAYERPKVEDLAVRKRRHAIEAPQAMSDYLRAQQAARDRLAVLRDERTEREREEKA